jgi:hypothetical protein
MNFSSFARIVIVDVDAGREVEIFENVERR